MGLDSTFGKVSGTTDEPVGNLDSESADNVLKILKELNTIDKKTVVMVTHNPEHLVYADRVIHMKDGRIIKEEIIKEKRPQQAKKELAADESPESSELKMLMASFKSLLPQQIDVLLVPFKAKQLLSHLLSELSEEQVSMAEAFMKELLFKNIDTALFQERLDLDLDDGGAGWNRMRAETFAKRTGIILDQAQRLKADPSTGPLTLEQYLSEHFHLKLDGEQKLRFQATLKLRLDSQIGQLEMQKRFDQRFGQGGVGLHKGTAEKMVREIEIIMLLKYS